MRRDYLHLCRLMMLQDDRTRRLLRDEWYTVIHGFVPRADVPHELSLDVTAGLPFEDARFEAVYANHVLEHVSPEDARGVVSELHRVVRPGSVVRIVVPNLESRARHYLESLEAFLAERTDEAAQRYRWAVLELLDQMVRRRPGGAMLEAFRSGDHDDALLRERFGDVFDVIRRARPRGLRESVRGKAPRELLYAAARRARLALWRGDTTRTAERELACWDRVSLELLLTDAGFADYRVLPYTESALPEWERYDFDRSALIDGPREPSIYVEARRP